MASQATARNKPSTLDDNARHPRLRSPKISVDYSAAQRQQRLCTERRVLHISSVHPYDDVRIIYRECLPLKRAGIDVTAAFFDAAQPNAHGIPTISIGQRPNSRIIRAIIATWKMFTLIKQFKPSIVHIHDPELLPLALLLKSRKIKVFYDAHEDLSKQIFHKDWIPRHIRLPASKAINWLLPAAFQRLDGLIVAARHIHDTSRIEHHRIILRNMPISRGASSPPVNGFDGRERAVAYIGAINSSRKTLETIQSILDTDCTIYLAGRGNQQYINEIVSLAPHQIRYLGILTLPEIPSLLNRCRVGLAVLPPTPAYMEAIPSKLFDYLDSGLPCIVSNFDRWHMEFKDALRPYAASPSDRRAISCLTTKLLDNKKHWEEAHQAVTRISKDHPKAEQESVRLIEMYHANLGFR